MSSHSNKAALLHRAKTLMPQLQYGLKHIKREPSPELKQRRMDYWYAARMQQRIATDRECLWIAVFNEDDFTMYLDNEKNCIVRSWGFGSEQAHAIPAACNFLDSKKQVKQAGSAAQQLLPASADGGLSWRTLTAGGRDVVSVCILMAAGSSILQSLCVLLLYINDREC